MSTLVFRLIAFPTKLALRLVQYPKMAYLPSGALSAVVSTDLLSKPYTSSMKIDVKFSPSISDLTARHQ